MRHLIWSTLAIASVLLVSGCGSSGGNGGDVNQPLGNDIQAIANQGPDDAALAVTDVSALQRSLRAVFGEPDDESVAVSDTTTLQQIVN